MSGAVGRSAANLFAIDLTKASETLAEGQNNTITVDDVKTWDVVEGVSDPTDANEVEWDDPDAILRDRN